MGRSSSPLWPLVVGLLARWAVLLPGTGLECLLDECSYERLAAALLNGQGYLSHAWHLWAPGYPTFLALHGWAGLDPLVGAKFTQTLLSVATQLVLYSMVRGLYGFRPALAVSWIFALYPTLIAFTHYIWAETLYIFLFILAVHLLFWLYRSIQDESQNLLLPGLLSGFVYGLACLVKPVPFYFQVFLLPWLIGSSVPRKRALAGALLFSGCCLLTILPWTVRNYLEYDRFLLIDATSGKNLWKGNRVGESFNRDYGIDRERPGLAPCQDPNLVDRDRCNAQVAMEYIRAHPTETVMESGTKLADLLSPNSFLIRHVRWSVYGELGEGAVTAISVLTMLSYAFVVLGGLIGLFLPLRGDGAQEQNAFRVLVLLLLLYYLLLHSLVFGMSRFRLPLMPFLMVFCARAIVEWRSVVGLLRLPLRLVSLLILSALLVGTWASRMEPLIHFGPSEVRPSRRNLMERLEEEPFGQRRRWRRPRWWRDR